MHHLLLSFTCTPNKTPKQTQSKREYLDSELNIAKKSRLFIVQFGNIKREKNV